MERFLSSVSLCEPYGYFKVWNLHELPAEN